jgi:hypothetical protein
LRTLRSLDGENVTLSSTSVLTVTVLRGDCLIGVRRVGSRFRFRDGGITSSISVVFCNGSGECSFVFEELPCANREREGRVLLRDVGERDVAVIILEVSFESLEVLISMVGQASCTADETYGRCSYKVLCTVLPAEGCSAP